MIALPERFNVGACLVDLAERWGVRPAFLTDDRTISFADAARSCRRAARVFRRLGVRAEERVLLLCPDVPELVSAFVGAMLAGSVPVSLSTMLRSDDTAPHKCPRSIAFVDDLPRTATGKIQRFKLRQGGG